jgi:membrane-bound lytic murein transglycosylase D
MKNRILTFVLIFMFSCFSQEDKVSLFPKKDTILSYDLLLDVKLEDLVQTQNNIFDVQKIRAQLDSLNQLTPLELRYTKEIGQHIKFYLFKRPEQVSSLLTLAEYYFPIFESYLDKHDLPLELKYIPIIESSLNPNAKSPAGAIGLWQFMYPTAKEHGLRVNSYLDERKDVYKSTEAACEYFRRSYKVFKNWELSIASYNAGRRNITKSMRRSGGKLNYWEIRPFLPKETQNYIPAFIAALYVMNFAQDYGITANKEISIQSYQIDSVHLNERMNLAHLAAIMSIDGELLAELNPVYKLQLIPYVENEKFPLILPNYKWAQFLNNKDSIYKQLAKLDSVEKFTYPTFSDIEKIKYIVKRGDYLGKIANKYNCKIKDIMLWNDLKNSKIKQGQRLYIYRIIK